MEIRHVGLNVKHLTRSMRFYEKLGFIPDSGSLEIWAGNEINIIKMRADGGALLELVKGVWQPHFAITVDEMPWIETQRVFIERTTDTHHIVLIKDFDGNIIELVREK